MKIDTANEWAATLKALAHPTRLQIVAELLKGTKCVTDIQEILPASQANISQHLTVLRHAGLVDFTQNGAQRCYFVSRPHLCVGSSPTTRYGVGDRCPVSSVTIYLTLAGILLIQSFMLRYIVFLRFLG